MKAWRRKRCSHALRVTRLIVWSTVSSLKRHQLCPSSNGMIVKNTEVYGTACVRLTTSVLPLRPTYTNNKWWKYYSITKWDSLRNKVIPNQPNRDSNLVDSASSIRLSQRLSHACLSINESILWNCEWLIISVIVYLMVLATWITVVILELIHASNPNFWKGCIY